MSELSGKTVAELRELAREREVASRTEINRARKATLLEWLEAPNTETPEESPANVEEDQQIQWLLETDHWAKHLMANLAGFTSHQIIQDVDLRADPSPLASPLAAV